ncbi:cell division protein ZapA [Novosphingobium sp. FSY-8]|uniref:Cell division protein ZapA n=1 Tax=Novosphingobium ovatum TaxID=1908523 RepID=A0ABW9XCY1_9SPHN|nr:cell division protein ZapA [Novosphingobium ovatum]NBC36391.1 cell division protein ZapA [Novosphingobium ovatum]
MSNISLFVGGRDYVVACAPGEEAHVTALGVLIDEKLDELPESVAQSEVRSLLFAALLLADEVVELRQVAEDAARAQSAVAEMGLAQAPHAAMPEPPIPAETPYRAPAYDGHDDSGVVVPLPVAAAMQDASERRRNRLIAMAERLEAIAGEIERGL